MNTNLSRDVEGVQLLITCMTMKALENQLNKGQKNGDATKVVTSGEIAEMDELTPRIENKVGTHIVNLENNCRKLPTGEIVSVKVNRKNRDMQLARIKEQKENSLEDNEK